MTLAATEFLRRFFLHVLPKGFVRIRHFGFLANRFRTQALALCRELLAASPPPATADREQTASWHCPHCGARNGSTAIVHSSRAAKPMSRARFLLATQNISDHTTCSAHAFASVCLHAAIIPPTRTESGPLATRTAAEIRQPQRRVLASGQNPISFRACCQPSFPIAASAAPTSGFLLVSLSKMTRPQLIAAPQLLSAAAFPIKASDKSSNWTRAPKPYCD